MKEQHNNERRTMKYSRHAICDACWVKREPNREPVRIKPEYCEEEYCCWCGITHRSGIYVRASSEDALVCPGHEEQ
jgi:hypothetical protein